jgi:hypothetical protein
VDNTADVNVSIDPFFFRVEYGLGICQFCPACCATATMDPGLLVLECAVGEFCRIRDPIPRNCLVKFDCPGCGATGLCPPYYHIYLDDFDPEIWQVDLRTQDDQPVNYELNQTRSGVVISFRPDRERFKENSVGDYDLVFDATEKVKPRTKYSVRARLEVSDYRYEQHVRYGLRR